MAAPVDTAGDTRDRAELALARPGTDRLAELERRIDALDAQSAARRLHARYAQACDDADPDAVTALFRDDGELWAGDRRLRGHDEIRAFYAHALGTTCHVVGAADLQSEDTAVVGGAAFLAVSLAGTGSQLIWGRYADRIDVPAAGADARFASRRITIEGRALLTTSPDGTEAS